MIIKKLLFLQLTLFISVVSNAQDWNGIAVPAEAGNANYTWQLVDNLSDSFDYETPSGTSKGTTFYTKWSDGFINAWPGFGNTVWTPNNSKVTGGNLELKATSLNAASNTNNFSAVHAKTEIIYPVYIETRMKVMNSVMANAVWMLSSNSKEEIDIVEAYGSVWAASNNTSRDWFARRMHLSHHTFSATNADYQPTDAGSWYLLPTANGSYWKNDFHRVGMYWRDPFHLEYYIDGVLVRTVTGATMIDPNNHLGGLGLSKPEKIIFSGAAQAWQVSGGIYPTVSELAVEADNIFKIDWIRTYKRVDALSVKENNYKASQVLLFTNPIGDYITIKYDADVNQVDIFQMNGALVKSVKNISEAQKTIFVSDLKSGVYVVKVKDSKGKLYVEKLIKK